MASSHAQHNRKLKRVWFANREWQESSSGRVYSILSSIVVVLVCDEIAQAATKPELK